MPSDQVSLPSRQRGRSWPSLRTPLCVLRSNLRPSLSVLRSGSSCLRWGSRSDINCKVVLLMNGVSLMEMLLNLIFYALDTAVVMDDMIDSILKLGLCGCYILVQVSSTRMPRRVGALQWIRQNLPIQISLNWMSCVGAWVGLSCCQ